MAKLGRGELEALLMDILWTSEGPMTPREVHDVLVGRRRPLAYTTVMTILVRLWEKGMLVREPRGRAFEYQPSAPRDEWAAQRMHEILERSGDRGAALAHFVQAITPREVAQLRRALDRRKR